MMRRVVVGLIIVGLLVGGVLLFAFMPQVRRAADTLVERVQRSAEDWSRDQIISIVQTHMGVEFTFESFALEGTSTAVFGGVRFSEGDVDILTCTTLRITLSELPAYGEPIVIGSVEADSPSFKLLADANGNLIGWANLIAPTEGAVDEEGGSTRFSDVFDLRTITIRDGSIEYQPYGDRAAMRFAGIDTELIAGAATDGWHAFELLLAREDVADIAVNGRMNLDEAVIEVTESDIDMRLAAEHYELFPPEIQTFLTQHELRGQLRINATGRIPIAEIAKLDLSGTVGLSDGNVAFGNAIIPVRSFHSDVRFAHDTLAVDQFSAELLGGSAEGSARLFLDDRDLIGVQMTATDLHLRQTVREVSGDEETTLAGRMDLTVSATGTRTNALDTIEADGTVEIVEGRLVRVPVVSDLVEALGGNSGETGTDQFTSTLRMSPDRPREVQFEDLHLVSGAVAARGTGSIFFDTQVDFRINAGPLERAQSLIPVLGDLFGAITDQLLKYHVTGTLEETEVKVLPLGIGG